MQRQQMLNQIRIGQFEWKCYAAYYYICTSICLVGILQSLFSQRRLEFLNIDFDIYSSWVFVQSICTELFIIFFAHYGISSFSFSIRSWHVWDQARIRAWKMKKFPINISNMADDAVNQKYAIYWNVEFDSGVSPKKQLVPVVPMVQWKLRYVRTCWLHLNRE